MSVQACIASRPSQRLVVPERYMPTCLRILVSLSETEVDYVDDMLVLASPDQEIVWLQIPMKEPVLMYELQSLKLYSYKFKLTIWIASIRTVLRLNYLLQYSKRSSSEGPRRSMTITL